MPLLAANGTELFYDLAGPKAAGLSNGRAVLGAEHVERSMAGAGGEKAGSAGRVVGWVKPITVAASRARRA